MYYVHKQESSTYVWIRHSCVCSYERDLQPCTWFLQRCVYLGACKLVNRGLKLQRVFLDVEETAAGPAITFNAESENLIDSLMSNLASSPANELDGQVSDALRNTLFGRKTPDNPMGGQDLVGRNIFRSRDVSLPTYAGLARCFGITPDAQVRMPRMAPGTCVCCVVCCVVSLYMCFAPCVWGTEYVNVCALENFHDLLGCSLMNRRLKKC